MEVDDLLTQTAFGGRIWRQTLSKPLAQPTEVEPSRPGFGEDASGVVRAGRAAAYAVARR